MAFNLLFAFCKFSTCLRNPAWPGGATKLCCARARQILQCGVYPIVVSQIGADINNPVSHNVLPRYGLTPGVFECRRGRVSKETVEEIARWAESPELRLIARPSLGVGQAGRLSKLDRKALATLSGCWRRVRAKPSARRNWVSQCRTNRAGSGTDVCVPARLRFRPLSETT